MRRKEKIYEGKAKIIYATDQPDLLIQYFKDSATAFDGKKKGEITGKGEANAKISAKLFGVLEEAGVKTHFKELVSDREMLVEKLEMIPLEFVVRNISAGHLSELLAYPEGRPLKKPIVEFYLKDDARHDPMLMCQHILELGLLTEDEFVKLKQLSFKINDVLRAFFDQCGLTLVDFKLEFGRRDSELVLGDEISPDSCRFWDKKTGEKLDKDRFRRDMGRVEEAYQEILKRVMSE